MTAFACGAGASRSASASPIWPAVCGWWRCRENSPSPHCTRRWGEGEQRPLWHPLAPTARVERHEVVADVDVDMAHAGVGHGAAGLVVGDQPAHHIALATACVEVDCLARRVLGNAPRSGDAGAGPAG